jgi:hypothetical protein
MARSYLKRLSGSILIPILNRLVNLLVNLMYGSHGNLKSVQGIASNYHSITPLFLRGVAGFTNCHRVGLLI